MCDEPFDDDDSLTVRCPNCRADVYEDADQCPHCGEWIVASRSPFAGRSLSFVFLGIVGALATIVVLSGLAAWL